MTGPAHIADDPALCCLPGVWDRVAVHDVMAYGEPLPPAVADIAAAEGVDPHHLGHHVEAIHGWEPHDEGYAQAVAASVECVKNGGGCP
ncbi:MAG TPA: hypothetical protein VI172_17220 [Candidatus Dormibacteraeota bacterium]